MFFTTYGRKFYTSSVLLGRKNQRIKLFGVMHMAAPCFYESILKETRQLSSEGWLITSEIVHDFYNTSNMQVIELANKAWRIFFAYHNLQRQADVMQDQGFVSVDVTSEEFERMISKNSPEQDVQAIRSLMRQLSNPEQLIEMYTKSFEKQIFSDQFKQYANGKRSLDMFENFNNPRSQHAVAKILTYLEMDYSSIVSIWGCAHIPAMCELLQQQGFEILHIQKMFCGELKEILQPQP